jgi:maltose O-acetyltransferase
MFGLLTSDSGRLSIAVSRSSLTERERMLAGEPYDPLDGDLVAGRARARAITRAYNETTGEDPERRRALLSDLLGAVGDGVWIEPPFRCDYGSNIYLGRNVFLNFDCVVLDCARVEIGDQTLVGPCVQIYAATHPLSSDERRAGLESALPVTIGDDVWIGGATVICPGVKIGPRTVVGAGSVVVTDLPADVVAAGNPCRVLRSLAAEES